MIQVDGIFVQQGGGSEIVFATSSVWVTSSSPKTVVFDGISKFIGVSAIYISGYQNRKSSAILKEDGSYVQVDMQSNVTGTMTITSDNSIRVTLNGNGTYSVYAVGYAA